MTSPSADSPAVLAVREMSAVIVPMHLIGQRRRQGVVLVDQRRDVGVGDDAVLEIRLVVDRHDRQLTG